jgi:hypothetical protein
MGQTGELISPWVLREDDLEHLTYDGHALLGCSTNFCALFGEEFPVDLTPIIEGAIPLTF